MTIPLRIPQVRVYGEASIPFSNYGARVIDPKPAVGDNPADYGHPASVFLIYLTRLPKWAARHMYAPAGPDPDVTAAFLFGLAKNDDRTSPYRVGDSFLNLVWTRPCYLYLVLDDDDAAFVQEDEVEFDPIQFYDKKPLLGGGIGVYQYYDANYSFYNGVILDHISTVQRSTFKCINYFKDEQGRELKYPQVRTYGFKILFQVTYEDGTRHFHDIDPDGQNQGPPASLMELEAIPA